MDEFFGTDAEREKDEEKQKVETDIMQRLNNINRKTLVREVIQNPDVRSAHIEDCYKTVMSKHTYKNRVDDIIEAFK